MNIIRLSAGNGYFSSLILKSSTSRKSEKAKWAFFSCTKRWRYNNNCRRQRNWPQHCVKKNDRESSYRSGFVFNYSSPLLSATAFPLFFLFPSTISSKLTPIRGTAAKPIFFKERRGRYKFRSLHLLSKLPQIRNNFWNSLENFYEKFRRQWDIFVEFLKNMSNIWREFRKKFLRNYLREGIWKIMSYKFYVKFVKIFSKISRKF